MEPVASGNLRHLHQGDLGELLQLMPGCWTLFQNRGECPGIDSEHGGLDLNNCVRGSIEKTGNERQKPMKPSLPNSPTSTLVALGKTLGTK
jgi:hypothetical protein